MIKPTCMIPEKVEQCGEKFLSKIAEETTAI